MTLSDLIYNNLNNNINENNKKFTILIDDDNKIKTDTNKYGKNVDIDGTLRNYINLLNKDYLLIETSGQKNIQPLDLRINQDRMVIDSVLLSL